MDIPFFERKLRSTEIFMLAWRLAKVHWKHILLIAAMFALPMYAVLLFIPEHLTAAVAEGIPAELLGGGPALAANSGLQARLMDIMTYVYLVLGITLLFDPAAVGALTYLAHQGVRRRPVTTAGILDVSLKRLLKYAVTSGILYAMCIFSAWLLFIPAIFMMVAYGFCASAIAVTGRWGPGAFRESYRVVHGQWLQTAGFRVLVVLVRYLLNVLIVSFIAMVGLDANAVTAVLASAAGSAILYVLTIAQALWYLNRREMCDRQEPFENLPPGQDGPDPRGL